MKRDRRRLRAAAAVGMGAVGVAVTVLAGLLLERNWGARNPGQAWTWSESVDWTTAILSCLLLATIGAFLGWRMDRNPIGWWLNAAGIAFAGWIVALHWSHPAGEWVQLVMPSVFRILVVLAVLAWPTGHFEPRWRRPLAIVLTVYALVGVLSAFVGSLNGFTPPWGRSDWMLPTVGSPELGALRQAVFAIFFLGAAPTAFIVAVARRRRRLPEGMRSVSTPAFVAAWVLAVADYWILVSNVLGRQLEFFDNGTTTLLGTLRSAVDFGRFGAVPVLLLLGYRQRRRAFATTDQGDGAIDLGARSGPDSIDAELAALLGTDGARLVFCRPDGSRVTSDGRPARPRHAEQRAVLIGDPGGATVAELELPVGAGVAPTTVEAVTATVRIDLVRARRMAEAGARLVEMRELQRQVLDRQDAARRRLERDLHDGVQQQLVALTLEVALEARRGAGALDAPSLEGLARSLESTSADVRQLVHEERPAVLDGGLAAALAALASSVAIPTELVIQGDLGPDHPMARTLWFATSEAVGNAMKHSGAGRLRIGLRVGQQETVLSVSDDGCGGVAEPPAAIAARVPRSLGALSVDSPVDGGTAVTITVPAEPGMVAR